MAAVVFSGAGSMSAHRFIGASVFIRISAPFLDKLTDCESARHAALLVYSL